MVQHKDTPDALETYWDSLSPEEKAALAVNVNRSEDYLRQVFKHGRTVGAKLALDIEVHTGGYIPRQLLRPDLNPPQHK